jgi:hypothetical protein
MIEINGASDDLIEIEGDISEEFSYCAAGLYVGDRRFLAFSDGTVLEASYDDGGIWRFHAKHFGRCDFMKKDAELGEDDRSDHVTLSGEKIEWVVFGTNLAM